MASLLGAGLGFGAMEVTTSHLQTEPDLKSISLDLSVPQKAYAQKLKSVHSREIVEVEATPHDSPQIKPSILTSEVNSLEWPSFPDLFKGMNPFRSEKEGQDTAEAMDTGLTTNTGRAMDTGLFQEEAEFETEKAFSEAISPEPILCYSEWHCVKLKDICQTPFSTPYNFLNSMGWGQYEPYTCYDLASL